MWQKSIWNQSQNVRRQTRDTSPFKAPDGASQQILAESTDFTADSQTTLRDSFDYNSNRLSSKLDDERIFLDPSSSSRWASSTLRSSASAASRPTTRFHSTDYDSRLFPDCRDLENYNNNYIYTNRPVIGLEAEQQRELQRKIATTRELFSDELSDDELEMICRKLYIRSWNSEPGD